MLKYISLMALGSQTGGAGGEASAARSENLHEHGGVPQVTGPVNT